MGESTPPPSLPPPLVYAAAGTDTGRNRVSFLGVLTGRFFVVAALLQLSEICGSPRLLFFHASDASVAPGLFTRFDRLCFVIPALGGLALGYVSLKRDGANAFPIVGITLALLSLLVISRVGFSR